MTSVFFGICVVALALSLTLCRNALVYEKQMEWVRRVSDAVCASIDVGQPWVWRYAALDAVSYPEMLLKFWRPLDSFVTPELQRAMTPPEGK